MTVPVFVLVSLFGGVGAACRFLLDSSVRSRWPREFPLGTLVVNVSGSFLIGVLTATVATTSPPAYVIGATGFCGGFTTFSTSMVESVRLARAGDLRRATANTVGTLLLTLAGVAAGVVVGQWLGG